MDGMRALPGGWGVPGAPTRFYACGAEKGPPSCPEAPRAGHAVRSEHAARLTTQVRADHERMKADHEAMLTEHQQMEADHKVMLEDHARLTAEHEQAKAKKAK